jgi:hypothetical protein
LIVGQVSCASKIYSAKVVVRINPSEATMARAKSVRRTQAPKGIMSLEQAMEMFKPDPAKAAVGVDSSYSVREFVKKFGATASQTFFPERLWLEAYFDSKFSGEKAQVNMICDVLRFRGAESLAQAVDSKESGMLLIELFGFQAHKLLPKDIANQVKGRHLEDELGL